MVAVGVAVVVAGAVASEVAGVGLLAATGGAAVAAAAAAELALGWAAYSSLALVARAAADHGALVGGAVPRPISRDMPLRMKELERRLRC